MARRADRRRSTAGSTPRSWPRPSATACRSPSIPGIGYDIIANHPVFNGAAIGRAAEWDFKLFGGSLERPRRRRGALDRLGHHGPAGLREGAELRQQPAAPGRAATSSAATRIYVVDLQDGGGWDWTQGEPPKTNPAYYLRFCKSYSRMGGALHYVQCDNADVPPSSLSPAGRLMNAERFAAITGRYPRLRIAVVGDFFLDRYLDIDPAKNETSIETGLTVHNVVEVRSQPGAAGTILNNLVALEIGEIHAVGFCGDDGEGYELRRALAALPGRRVSTTSSPRRAPDARLLQAAGDRARPAAARTEPPRLQELDADARKLSSATWPAALPSWPTASTP